MEHKKQLRLKDIAAALELSVSTVSRALNDKSDINQATKTLVMDYVKKHGYTPNPVALSLKKQSAKQVIGIIVPKINHYFFSNTVAGIMSKANLDHKLILTGESSHDINVEKKVIDSFISYGVSGLIIAPAKTSDFSQNLLPVIHRRIPVVIMDRSYDNYNGNFVIADDFSGAYMAVSHLIENGYQRIAHIASTDKWSVGNERLRGYKQALIDNDISINDQLIHFINPTNIDQDIESSIKVCLKFFSEKEKPDAIFTATDNLALGVYKFADKYDIKIPDQLGIVGYSNSKISEFLSPKLTTVNQNGFAMGEKAYEILHNITKQEGRVYQKVFDTELIVRESSMRSSID